MEGGALALGMGVLLATRSVAQWDLGRFAIAGHHQNRLSVLHSAIDCVSGRARCNHMQNLEMCIVAPEKGCIMLSIFHPLAIGV